MTKQIETLYSSPENEKPGQKLENGLFIWMFLAFFVCSGTPSIVLGF